MSSTFIKIQANQATISPSQNLLDFELPSYMNGIDMNESFIHRRFSNNRRNRYS